MTEATIALALQDLESGRFPSLRACAKAHNLNHSTLSRRRRGHLSRVESHTQQQKLSSTQEDMMVRWLVEAEKAGHAFNHAQLRDLASLISKTSGGDGQMGINWIPRFLKRHPEVHTKKSASIVNESS